MNLTRQKDAVESYWAARGYAIKTELVDTGVRYRVDGETLKALRSNLVNGLPQGFLVATRCAKCAEWTKQGLPVRCAKCDATEAIHAKQHSPNGTNDND